MKLAYVMIVAAIVSIMTSCLTVYVLMHCESFRRVISP